MSVTDITPSQLQDILLNDECKCESKHTADGTALCSETVCSKTVVARKKTCQHQFNICANSRDWNLQTIAARGFVCSNCEHPVSECWTIIPI